MDLDKGKIKPNVDEKNHVLKIVCGRGSHSHGKPVLKTKVPKFLVRLSLLKVLMACTFRLREVMISVTSVRMVWFWSGFK